MYTNIFSKPSELKIVSEELLRTGSTENADNGRPKNAGWKMHDQ